MDMHQNSIIDLKCYLVVVGWTDIYLSKVILSWAVVLCILVPWLCDWDIIMMDNPPFRNLVWTYFTKWKDFFFFIQYDSKWVTEALNWARKFSYRLAQDQKSFCNHRYRPLVMLKTVQVYETFALSLSLIHTSGMTLYTGLCKYPVLLPGFMLVCGMAALQFYCQNTSCY